MFKDYVEVGAVVRRGAWSRTLKLLLDWTQRPPKRPSNQYNNVI